LPRLIYQKPLDQPFGTERLADWIIASLADGRFDRFRLVSAFAKEGPLARIVSKINRFRERGATIEAIFGIDQLGTSVQALTLALAEFDRVYVWHHPSPFTTFHPKFYMFQGEDLAEVYIGSNNLTVGGLESNCEAGVRISYGLPVEAAEWELALACWSELIAHPNTIRLDLKALATLQEQKKLLDESVSTTGLLRGDIGGVGTQRPVSLFPYSRITPPTPRPRRIEIPSEKVRARATAPAAGVAAAVLQNVPKALVIQIVPHHNGEVFLSKLAVNQQPLFFGFPFTGQTIPKKSGNRPYPQRTPDPVTNWFVYDRQDRLVKSLESIALNTVYYELKGEIRITIPPELGRQIPRRSILVMTRVSPESRLDYQCEVFPPRSPQYRSLYPACTEKMPAGDSGPPRKFGWL